MSTIPTFDEYTALCFESAKVCIAGSLAVSLLGKLPPLLSTYDGAVITTMGLTAAISWHLFQKNVDPSQNKDAADLNLTLVRNITLAIAPLTVAVITTSKIPLLVAPFHGGVFGTFAVTAALVQYMIEKKFFPDFNPEAQEVSYGLNLVLAIAPLALVALSTAYVIHKGGSRVYKEITYTDILKPSIFDAVLYFGWTHLYEPSGN